MTVSKEDTFMLRVKTAVGLVFLAATTVILAQDAAWLKGTTDEKFKTLEAIQPGLGSVMVEYSNRAGNVFYAAQAGNWGLAAYQLNEMTEIQEVAEKTRPARAKALRGFEQSALRPLAKDIVNQDATAFRSDFDRMVVQCNGCHRANGYGFIVYKLPDRPAMPATMDAGMKFAKADLEKLVGDLVK
jgi:hypothetical protein